MSILNHIAIIPDGNRRWAKARGLTPWKGHVEGKKRFREVSQAALDAGVRYFTFWAASEDNLRKRTRTEVAVLVRLLREEVKRLLKTKELERKETRFRMIGRWNTIIKNSALKRLVALLEENTARFKERNLTVLFDYDGKQDTLSAIETLIKNKHTKITPDAFAAALAVGVLPPVDLVVRTGGEPHLSAGFMMWHTADSQLYFTDMFWPDFTPAELQKALHEFTRRERRFGK